MIVGKKKFQERIHLFLTGHLNTHSLTKTPTRPSIIPTPTESPETPGKKGEDPEDHILKVKDYLGVHQITAEGDKISRFKDTLFGTARKWAQTLNYDEVKKFDYNADNPNDKKTSMKYLFLARFAKEGRTLEAAYNCCILIQENKTWHKVLRTLY